MIASNRPLTASRVIETENERKFQVYCRVRPLQQSERSEDIAINDDSPTITIFNHIKNTSKQFTFHRIFGENTRQVDFCESLANQVYLNCLQNGRGCLVLSYGVTNSGKTYTIMGNNAQPGLLPTLVSKLEKQMNGQPISIRAMEIYTDEIYCLRTRQRAQLKEAWSGYDFIGGCQYERIDSSNAKEVLGAFVLNRKAAETNSNRASSRSHAIFMLECGEYHIGLADLAGNQRFGTHANIQETFSINKNLLVLGKCIHAFRDGERMPYRECKLTLALMEYFKPNYKIYMIAHLNRSGQMFHQNVNVLEYAAVSTQVRHINLKKNHSIAKSIKKTPRQETFQQFSERKPELADNQRYQNKLLLDRYRCYIIGKQAQIQENIDEYFRKEDEKDKKFLEELRANKYVSPMKERQLWLDKLEAQSRIKLRQMFLDEVEAQKRENLVEYGTVMGTSMKKNCYEYFKPKNEEIIIKKNEHQNETREENLSTTNEQEQVQENIAFENSLLLDGIRSQKDASTNDSGIFLLRDSTTSLPKNNIEAIPELIESQTATKSTMLFSNQLKKHDKSIIKANIQKQSEMAIKLKKNETNFKSTQQTMSQSVTKSKSPLKQKSPTPNKHRNHNCGAHPLPAKQVQKMNNNRRNLRQSMKKSLSALKTRNQRRKQKKQQQNININRNFPKQKKRKMTVIQ